MAAYDRLKRNGQAAMSDRLSLVLFCHAVGWTYEQYLAQPKWFVELLRYKLQVDSES